jgi:ketosteroid isomerase-like protein
VERVLVEYCYAVDQRDPAAVVQLFAEDGTLDSGHGRVVSGREQLEAFFAGRVALYDACSHSLSNVLVELDGTTARASSYVHARLWFREAEPGELWGRYDDELVRAEAGWQFAHRRLRAYGWSGFAEGAAPFERFASR